MQSGVHEFVDWIIAQSEVNRSEAPSETSQEAVDVTEKIAVDLKCDGRSLTAGWRV
jgi:hypothetical protein